MWESRLSGSVRDRVATRATGEIQWHRRETRWTTENTNFTLRFGERPVYSKPPVFLPRSRVRAWIVVPWSPLGVGGGRWASLEPGKSAEHQAAERVTLSPTPLGSVGKRNPCFRIQVLDGARRFARRSGQSR